MSSHRGLSHRYLWMHLERLLNRLSQPTNCWWWPALPRRKVQRAYAVHNLRTLRARTNWDTRLSYFRVAFERNPSQKCCRICRIVSHNSWWLWSMLSAPVSSSMTHLTSWNQIIQHKDVDYQLECLQTTRPSQLCLVHYIPRKSASTLKFITNFKNCSRMLIVSRRRAERFIAQSYKQLPMFRARRDLAVLKTLSVRFRFNR